MSSDYGDSTVTNEQLALLVASDSDGFLAESATFSGRARPVVLPDAERALLWESDDPSVIPTRFPPPRDMPLSDGEALPSRPAHGETSPRGLVAVFISWGFALGSIVAIMLVVALIMALAAR